MKNKASDNQRKHPDYNRWMGMNTRCYNPKADRFQEYQEAGITVDYIWRYNNPTGFQNFLLWLEVEIHKETIKNPRFNIKTMRVARVDITKSFGPSNCHLTSRMAVCQNRIDSVLDADTVIAMRRYKKDHPNTQLKEMSKMFNHSVVNISRSLRGISWSNVNDKEAPILKHKS